MLSPRWTIFATSFDANGSISLPSRMADCSNKQSAEHYVTRGLWSASEIIISGFDWQKGEAKMLPVATLESKILCEYHNNKLSEVDAEATRIFRFVGQSLSEFQDRETNLRKRKRLLPRRYQADGRLFERWCAKTLIDYVCVEKSDTVWHGTTDPMLNPPIEILKAVYGQTKFDYPMGLYLAQESTKEPQYVLREQLNVDPRFHPDDGGLMGAFLEFRDFRFLIWLSRDPFETFVTETRTGIAFGKSGNAVLYHPDALKIAFNHVVEHKVIFRW